MKSANFKYDRRAQRSRVRLKGVANGRMRMSVFRSAKNISVQVIDDGKGETLASASTLEEAFRKEHKKGSDKKAAAVVGKLIAERAKAANITRVVFDRGGRLFHGRVKALADAAREGGLEF
jgi:large subunit ribosomal protein L18